MPIDPLTGERIPERGASFPAFTEPEESGTKILPDLDDILLAIPRGVEGLGRSVIGLVSDNLFGTNIAAERSDTFGRSDTVLGGILEAGVQLAIPFAASAKIVRGLGFLARGATSARSAVAANAATKAGLTAAGRRLTLPQLTVAGGAADFIAFGGNEARLSNFIQQIPSLANPVTEFLQADPDSDPEILGRIKNVLEGAAIGFAFDSIAAILVGVRAGRKVANAGGTPEDIVTAAKKRFEGEGAEEKTAKFVAEVRRQADEADKTAFEPIPEERALVPKFAQEEVERLPNREADELRRRRGAAKDIEGRVEQLRLRQAVESGVDPTTILTDRLLSREFTTKAQLDRGVVLFDQLARNNSGQILRRLGGDPKKLSLEARALIGLSLRGGLNLKDFAAEDPGGVLLIRAFEKTLEESGVNLRLPKQTEEEMVLSSLAIMQDLAQLSPEEALDALDLYVTRTEEVGLYTIAIQTLLGNSGARVARLAALTEPDVLGRARPEDLAELNVSAQAAQGVEAIEAELFSEFRRFGGYVQALNKGASNIGRSLRARQIPATRNLFDVLGGTDVNSVSRIRAALGEADYKKALAALSDIASKDELTRTAIIARFQELTPGRRFLALTTEWTINALLHSPKTVVTNGLFPFMTSFYIPLENMIGGAASAAFGRKNHLAIREAHTLMGMVQALPKAVKGFRRAFKDGPRLDPATARRDDPATGGGRVQLFSSEVFTQVYGDRFTAGTFAGGVVNALGKFMSFPNKLIASADEFNKTMVAHGHAHALLTEQALERNAEPSQYVAENIDKLFNDGRLVTEDLLQSRAREVLAQEATSAGAPPGPQRFGEILRQLKNEANFDDLNPITTSLISRAREATATAPLEEGTFGRTFEKSVNAHPVLRLITPFIRTPVNLVNFANERINPANLPRIIYRKIRGADNIEHIRNRNVQDILSGNPEREAAAMGRIVTGLGVVTTTIYAANAGLVTGGGPRDPERRRALLDAGWLPYSFHDGENYVQFLRADPFSIMLGLVADTVETTRLLGEDSDNSEIDNMTMGLLASIGANLTSRTYLAGLRTFLEALTRGERFGGQFVANLATAPIPRSIQQALQSFQDPVLRDVHDINTRVSAKVPFLSDEVPPLRNVLGEPITKSSSLGAEDGTPASIWYDLFIPIAYREVSDDLVRNEFAALQHGFSPPSRSRLGVNLQDFTNERGQDAYDRFGQLHGVVKVRGRTLRQELKRTIRSRTYKQLPAESTAFEDSPRVRALRSIVSRYRAQAFEQTLQEYPELSRELSARQRDQRRLRAGLNPLAGPLPTTPPPFASFTQQ